MPKPGRRLIWRRDRREADSRIALLPVAWFAEDEPPDSAYVAEDDLADPTDMSEDATDNAADDSNWLPGFILAEWYQMHEADADVEDNETETDPNSLENGTKNLANDRRVSRRMPEPLQFRCLYISS